MLNLKLKRKEKNIGSLIGPVLQILGLSWSQNWRKKTWPKASYKLV